jgi:hypothetical protein
MRKAYKLIEFPEHIVLKESNQTEEMKGFE